MKADLSSRARQTVMDMSGRLVLIGYGRAAQIGPINIGPKLFTFDRTARNFLNRRTVVSRHVSTYYPVVNNLRLNTNSIG